MTDRQLIAEYILQKIKQGDFVEIVQVDKRIIRGYVIDKDVFRNDLATKQNDLKVILYGEYLRLKKQITIRVPNKNAGKPIEIISGFLALNNMLDTSSTIHLSAEEILSIKKIKE